MKETRRSVANRKDAVHECKLNKTVKGITYFAWVQIRLVSNASFSVLDRTPVNVNRDSGEANTRTHPDWIAAALEGASDCLKHLSLQRGSVEILNVFGTDIDTRPDIVKCASGLAVWHAATNSAAEPRLVFDGVWHIRYPDSAEPEIAGNLEKEE